MHAYVTIYILTDAWRQLKGVSKLTSKSVSSYSVTEINESSSDTMHISQRTSTKAEVLCKCHSHKECDTT